MVLTFRNVHNWAKGGFAHEMFKAFYDVLKPGGMLGVTDHRAKPGTPFDKQIESGYLTEDYVIGLARRRRLQARSEIGDERESARHQGPSTRRLDVAAFAGARRSGSR